MWGRSPKHKISQEVREQELMLRRGKYDGCNDQHFAEKLVVHPSTEAGWSERLELAR
ncbi:MAG TPA: hypothetical protein VFK05_31160 [Polyangiaceae bacterium]|nr:hypothetical protein [Polyangiaceae bacterium]